MIPGSGRPLVGELAAVDCLLEYHGVIDMCPSIRVLEGEVAPDINFGVAVVDIPLGEAVVDIKFGVASGVKRWFMCEGRTYFWTGGLAAVPNRLGKMRKSLSEWIRNIKIDNRQETKETFSGCASNIHRPIQLIWCRLTDSSIFKIQTIILVRDLGQVFPMIQKK